VRPGLRVLTGLPRADRWPEIRDVALADVLARCREVARWTVLDVGTPVEQDEELSFDTVAPRRNGATLTALAAADTVLVVGTGDPIGLQRLVRACDLLGPLSAATREVVVTRVRTGPVGPDPERRIRETLHRFAGVSRVHLVPEDREALDAASLHGQALVEVRPASAARAALQELAALLHGPDPVNRRARPRRALLRRRRNG
jgi:MinD-like ATPase involved in chromosome partitioning or flagellar assembly